MKTTLKLALDALLWANEEINKWMDDAYGLDPVDHPEIMSAITAIKTALAQPEHEPVAWLQFRDNEPPVVAPRDLGTPVFLGIRGGLAHDAQSKEQL